MPKDKPQEPILLSTQFYQIQQQAQQRVLEEAAPLHTTIQPNNIILQDSNLLQSHLTTPMSEILQFQQVPIFEYDSTDNNIDEEAFCRTK